jgi:hypothetical protein
MWQLSSLARKSAMNVRITRPAAIGACLLLSISLAVVGCGGSSTAASAPPFVVNDAAFAMSTTQTGCINKLRITGVSSAGLEVKTEAGSWAAFDKDGNIEVFCPGALHTWVGTLTYSGYTFASDSTRPLQFTVGNGYAYIGGKGTVTSPDGSTVTLDSPERALLGASPEAS